MTLPPMATSVESINKPSEEELMISLDDIRFKLTSLKALDFTSPGNLKAQFDSLCKKNLSLVQDLKVQVDSLWKEMSSTPEVLMPPVDKASHIPPSQGVETLNPKTETLFLQKSTTPDPALTEGTTPEVLMPPVDKASHIPPSQGVETLNSKTETLCLQKSTTPEPALREDAEHAAAKGFGKDKELTYGDLNLLSNNFSPDNYMGRTHFGMLYKGFVPEGWNRMRSREVTIKVWKNKHFIGEDNSIPEFPEAVRFRMGKEIRFLQQPDIAMHSCTANVMGYCLEDDKLGVVYDLKPLQTLQKYIDNDDFGWFKRVNVAVKLAHLLKFFHENEPQYIIRNLSPAHVMLDQDLNPVLIDYAMIQGGSFVEERLEGDIGLHFGSCGYACLQDLRKGPTQRSDVHAYGVMLLEILRRCRYDGREVKKRGGETAWITELAWGDYLRHKVVQARSGSAEFNYSFAHKSLRNDPDYDALDGKKMTLVALKCVERKLQPRMPTIGEVMKELKELKVVQTHPELLLLGEE